MATVTVAENSSALTTVAATDADQPTSTLTFSIVGGADAAQFVINASTGALNFVVAWPNFEGPLDAGADNVYDVVVQVSDGGLTDTQAIAVTVTNVNEAPGGSDRTVGTNENTAYVFGVLEFGFADVDAGDSLSAVRIDTVPLAGSLTLNGVAVTAGDLISAAQLGAGNLVFTPAASANGTPYASFTFSVRDPGNVFDTSPKQLTINVGALNDAPVVTVTAQTLAYTENDTATPVDAALTLSDIDSIQLSAASVTISANHQNGQDVLAVVDAFGITSAWNAATGVLSFSGSATVAHYQAVLRSVTYVNTSDNPNTARRTVTFNVTDDGALPSNNASRNISVAALNDAPVLAAASPYLSGITEDEVNNGGQTVASFVGSTISDADSASASLGIAITAAMNGNANWQFSLDNGASWNSVGAVSDSAALLLRRTDLLRLVPNAMNATMGTLDYRAWAGSTGAAGLKTSAVLNGGSTAFSTNTNTVLILVSDVNDAPIITSNGGGGTASVVTAETLIAVTTITAGDMDSAVLTYGIVGGADAARFTIDANTGALRFITAPDFEVPTDSDANNIYDVTVQVSDGAGTTAAVTQQALRVTVLNANEAPVLSVPAVTTLSDAATPGTRLTTAFAADPDAGDALEFTLVSNADGRFVIDAVSGQISVAVGAVFDMKIAAGHDLLVRVSDKAGLTAERGLRVNLQASVRDNEVTPPATTVPAYEPQAISAIAPAAAVFQPEPAATQPVPAAAVTKLTDGSNSTAIAAENVGAGDGTSSGTSGGTEALLAKRKALDGGDRTDDSSSVIARLRRRESGSATEAPSLPLATPTLLALLNSDLAALSPSAISVDALAATVTVNQNAAGAANNLGHGLRLGATVDTDSDTAQQTANIVNRIRSRAPSFDQVFTPAHVTSVSFSAGFIWWLTRGGGLLTSMLMGVPAWRHVDLLPVLARNFDEEDADDALEAPLPRKPSTADADKVVDTGASGDLQTGPRAGLTAADINVEGLFDRGPEAHALRAPNTPHPPAR